MIEKSKALSKRLRYVDSCGTSVTRNGYDPIFWKSAKGVHVIDADGNSIIDCTSCFGVLGIGHNHPHLVKKLNEQLSILLHTMCEINPHEQYLCALEKIIESVGRQPNSQVLLTTSGSEAVEVALKLAYSYTGKLGIISFYGAFHGQTLGALSVTSLNGFRDPFFPLIANNVVFVEYPNMLRSGILREEELIRNTIKMLENVVSSGHSGAHPIGAVIIEPFQNASGYIMPPLGFISELRIFCKKHNILLIADEIFTGFGRCGKWLSFDYENTVADIVCVGKVMGGGLPSAACLASKDIMSSLDDAGLIPLHGSTFQGNPLSCAAIIATIEILKSEDLINKSYDLGERFRMELRSILGDLDIVGDIRGQGSATAVEFVIDRSTLAINPKAAVEFNSFLLDNGIATLVTGVPYGNSIAFCPPFILGDSEFETIIDACKKYRRSLRSKRRE